MKKQKGEKIVDVSVYIYKNITYLQLCMESCGRNPRFFNIFLELHHLFTVKQRAIWNCIDASLHVLDNYTATVVCTSCFDLNCNKRY